MVRSEDYPITNPYEGYPEEFRELVRKYVRNNPQKTRTQIAEEVGVAVFTLHEWCGKSDRAKKRIEAEKRRDREFDYVQHLHWEGWTYHAIARETGIPVSTVWDYINRPRPTGDK